MSFVPMSGRVAVIRDGVGDKVTQSGIYIPETAQDKPLTATVVAVAEHGRDEGEHANLKALKPGDRIVLGKYSGADIEVGGQHLTVVSVGDILGKETA